VSDFEGEEAVWPEGGPRLGNETAIDFEAVATGEESYGGFVLADLGMECVAVGGGDVRRV
jgi:hypothetical protein